MKEEDRLGLGVHGDGAAWLAEARQMLDFNLKRLAHRARSGKLEGVRLEAGTLIVTPTAGEVPAAVEELNAEISDMFPMVEVPDLLREVHDWTGFADHFTHVRTGDVPRNVSAMLAGVLADATNLGPKRMASASKGISARVMGIARSTYYDCPEKRADDTAIVEAMFAICDEFEFYGFRRVGAALRQQGVVVNKKMIRRLMREHCLQPKIKRRFVATTDSDHGGPIFPNLAQDIALTGSNQLWGTDAGSSTTVSPKFEAFGCPA